MKKTFYSNGKLLLTGEYTVLDGAKALALPTKHGQYLDIEENNTMAISWKSFDADGSLWYEDTIPFEDIITNRLTGDNKITNTLTGILHHAGLLNPKILKAKGYTVVTRLTFPRKWGLGTSSTLINNIAQWFNIDAYMLLWESFGGSGYDIACAQHNTPIIYQIQNNKPLVHPINFNSAFTDCLYFVYLNKKQDSRAAIASYRNRKESIDNCITMINNLTNAVATSTALNNFSVLIEEHEALMSELLGTPPVKQQLFADFNGSVKSLGAWGGDFVLAASQTNPSAYFKEKGYETIISYNDMIL